MLGSLNCSDAVLRLTQTISGAPVQGIVISIAVFSRSHIGVPATFLLQAGKRQDSSSEQVHMLQQQLEAEQVARTAAESRADLLRNKLREVAERSKARGNSLAALLSAVRRVADAKQELSAAEAELQQALQDAEAFLQVTMQRLSA